MAFYNVRESAVQTPDDIGVDLDQVEKDIAGPDGIEAHRDDVEAAEEGLIGDPIEEAYNIMFESEFNYNQILQTIGLNELAEAHRGRELVLEAASIKGFFESVKKFFVEQFARLTKAVTELLGKLDLAVKNDAKFVRENGSKIDAGADKVKYDGYEYPAEIDYKFGNAEKHFNDIRTKVANKLNAIDDKKDKADAEEVFRTFLDDEDFSDDKSVFHYFEELSDANARLGDLDGAKEALYADLRGDKKALGAADVAVAKKILSSARETAAIRAAYSKVKQIYKGVMKQLDEMKSAVEKKDSFVDTKLRVCNIGIKNLKTGMSMMHVKYAIYMKIARARRAQARALCHKAVAASNKKDTKEETPKNESALTGSIFDRITII